MRCTSLVIACACALAAASGASAKPVTPTPHAKPDVVPTPHAQGGLLYPDMPRVQENAFGISRGMKTDDKDAKAAKKVKREGEETYEFQAEVNRLMDIIINSLYQNKDIFLRELISNASDALDKLRYMSLTNPDILKDNKELEIKIKFDKDKGTISIIDSGIGMTKDDLINNLGTIAKSGTSNFLEKMSEGGDMSLIGQFGVGFYSVYLVSDLVTVTTKSPDDKQWVWESAADASFTVAEDKTGEKLPRGTMITMTLKEDAQEFLDEAKLKEVVKNYSEFINYPMYLWTSYEEEVEVKVADDEEDEAEKKEDAADDEKKEDGEKKDGEDKDDEFDFEEEDEKPTTKKVKETKFKWTLINEQKAIWTRDPSDVEEEDYNKFYKAIAKDSKDPLTYTHFKAEGEVEFRSILFVPGSTPSDMFDNYYQASTAIRMYVRRVLITDEFEDLVPRYLRFVRGVVDSDDLPLNVSRETLQEHRVLKVIKKKVVRKILDMIRKLAEAEEEEEEEEGEEGEEGADEKKDEEKKDEAAKDDKAADTKDDKEDEEEEGPSYSDFWESYAKNIKLGVMEDSSNKSRLAKLLRFKTSKSEDSWTSLEDYVERMKEGQQGIYYITGADDTVKKSPALEALKAKDYEVLYLTDAVDEYCFQQLTEYDGHKMMSATKEGLKFGDEEAAKKLEEFVSEKYKDLTTFLKEELKDSVEKVQVSMRLVDSPATVVTSQYGWSANMERIQKAQALGNSDKQSYMKARKTFEINARHPIVAKLKELLDKDDKENASNMGKILFDSTLLTSGFQVDDGASFATRINKLISSGLSLDVDAPLLPEFELPAEEEKKEEEEPAEEAPAEEAPAEDKKEL